MLSACSRRAVILTASFGFRTESVDVTGRQRGDDGLRVERVRAVDGEGQRCVFLPERAVQAEAVALAFLLPLDRREGVAGIQRVPAEPEAGRSPPVVQSRTRGDVDRHESRLVHVGGEHVAAESNLLNLALRRQPAAAEPVDAKHGTRPADVAQRLFHLVGIVGELVDLLLVRSPWRKRRCADRSSAAADRAPPPRSPRARRWRA